jgi:uncharacterized peroxidase-related enzyme
MATASSRRRRGKTVKSVAYIELGVDETRLPGILGLIAYRPQTAGPLQDLVNVLLVAPNSLSRGDRELIAAYVSGLNECDFCRDSHSAFAAEQLKGGAALVADVHADPGSAPISTLMKALLPIAAAVQRGGRAVSPSLVSRAKAAGATDVEIHDTVLIAAAFCMFNRYVDGLGTQSEQDSSQYAAMAKLIATSGYDVSPGVRGDE